MRFRDPFCVDPITRHRIFYFLDAVVRHLGFLELKFLTATHFGYMFYIILPNLVIYRQQAKQTGKQKHYYSAADRIRTVYEAARPNAFELPRLPLLLEALAPIRCMFPRANPTARSKRYLDWYNRFCKAQQYVGEAHRETDTKTTRQS